MSSGSQALKTSESKKKRGKINVNRIEKNKTYPKELPVITNLNPKEYTSEIDFTEVNLGNPHFWHEFHIYHSEEKNYTKSDIIDSLFGIVKHAKFVPIAYRENKTFDSFFVRDCIPAIRRFSVSGFTIQIPFEPENVPKTNLNIKLRAVVGVYEQNQISVETQLQLVFNRLLKNLVTRYDVAHCLDFSNFLENPELCDIIFNLNNNTNQSAFATYLRRASTNVKQNINGLILSNNNFTGIKTLLVALLGHFPALELIDFSNNNFKSVDTLIQVKGFSIKHIVLTGNPFITNNTKNYTKKLRESLPRLIITDKPPINPAVATTSAGLSEVLAPISKIAKKPPPFQLPPTAIPQLPLYKSKVIPPAASKTHPPLPKVAPTPVKEAIPTKPVEVTTLSSTNTMTSSKSTDTMDTITTLKRNEKFQATLMGDEINSGDINKTNLHLFRKYKTSTMWHCVIINHEGKYKKPIILKSIFKAILPNDFFPCYYMEDKYRDSFFVRNSYDQLEQLYSDNLIVKICNDSTPSLTESLIQSTKSETINLTLRMNVAEYKPNSMDPKDQVQKCLSVCYNLIDKTLNFENFANHSEFADVELNLSHPPIMAHILLHSSRRFLSNIETLKLNNNGLTTTNGMRPIVWMKHIKSIDLSNNKFESLSCLESLPKQSIITDVYLHDNPFCKDMAPMDYITKVRELFPDLKTLDGHELTTACMNISQKNYLCSLEGYDLIEQFVKQYFTTYDLSGRPQIKNLYTDKAIMTLSSNFTGISNKSDTQIRRYISRSRNLLKMINKNTAIVTTFEGSTMIEGIWRSFGKTEHDFQSFTIDMTFYSSTSVVFTVNGLFKEQGATLNEEDITLGFVRTFVIRKDQSGLGLFGNSVRYKITNEQVLIYRPTIFQLNNSFGHRHVPMDLEEELSEEERESLIVIFQELTQLIPLWCIRFLEQAQWQVRSALELFVKLLEENKVPDEAFTRY